MTFNTGDNYNLKKKKKKNHGRNEQKKQYAQGSTNLA